MSILLLDQDGLGTYHLAQYLDELDATTEVYASTALTLDDIHTMDPSHIIVSPSIESLEKTMDLIKHVGPNIPILAIGLGFLAVVHVFHGETDIANSIIIGEKQIIHHEGAGLFEGLPTPFHGICYQRQSVNLDNLPKQLDIAAWSQKANGDMDNILAVQHQTWPLHALLFHPEAMLSEHGHTLLRHFLSLHQPN